MLMLIVELAALFGALFIVNRDVEKNNFDRKVLWMWVAGTAVAYFFLWLPGVLAVLLIYFGMTRSHIIKQK